MALLIEQDCINCDMCELECPNEAIFMGKNVYQINSDKCTECVGHYDQAQCVNVCPIDCIISDPEHPESAIELQAKYQRLCY